jgi:ankyrin repeat protein
MRPNSLSRTSVVVSALAVALCLPTAPALAQEESLDHELFAALDSFSTSDGVVEELVARGANPNATIDEGVTPLMFAAIRGNERGAAQLLAAGAKIEATAVGGATALMLAARGDEKDVVEILLDAGAKVDRANDEGLTALMYAAYNGAWRTVDLFIERGLDLEQATADGMTAVLVAAELGQTSVLGKLLEGGAKMPATARGGVPTLVWAAANGDEEVLQRVIERLPNLEVPGPGGETPLIAAAAAGQSDSVVVLLRRGASRDAKDSGGRTALARAQAAGHADVAAILGGEWKRHEPPAGAVTLALDCEKLGGKVVLALEPSGDRIELAAYYPNPVAGYFAAADDCPLEGSSLSLDECGIFRTSANARFYLDLDDSRTTGNQWDEDRDAAEARGAETAVYVSESRTQVQTAEGGIGHRQILVPQVVRGDEALSAEAAEGGFQGVVQELNRISLTGPMSALGLQPGSKLRFAGEIQLCGAAERVVTLK